MTHDPSNLPPFGEPHTEALRDSVADCPAELFTPLSSTLIASECRQIYPNGVIRIALSPPVRDWFEFQARLGEFIQLTRSSVAVLAKCGRSLTLGTQANSVLPHSRCGNLAPNLAEFATLWAGRELLADGPLYFLEVRDLRGQPSQRIVIPPGEGLLLFKEFVCAHQIPVGQHGPWFPPNHINSAKRRSKLLSRIPWLRQCVRLGMGEARKL